MAVVRVRQRRRRRGLTPPFTWHGSKVGLAPEIVRHFPRHRVYVEAFGGTGAVLLAKPSSEVEVFNDLDSTVVNFYRVLRDPESFARLRRLADLTPSSREEFGAVAAAPTATDAVTRAWAFIVLHRQVRGGLGTRQIAAGAWAISTRTRRHMAESVSKWLSAIDGLADVSARLRTVAIEHMPAVELIERSDARDVLFYLDPPYMASTRAGGKAAMYRHEMTDADHDRLLRTVRHCRGKVILSGYPSRRYDAALNGWRRVERNVTSHVANSGQKRREVLWMNFKEGSSNG